MLITYKHIFITYKLVYRTEYTKSRFLKQKSLSKIKYYIHLFENVMQAECIYFEFLNLF